MNDQERDYFENRARERLDPFSESSIAKIDKMVEGAMSTEDYECAMHSLLVLRQENATLRGEIARLRASNIAVVATDLQATQLADARRWAAKWKEAAKIYYSAWKEAYGQLEELRQKQPVGPYLSDKGEVIGW